MRISKWFQQSRQWFVLALLAGLAACHSPIYTDAQVQIDKARTEIATANDLHALPNVDNGGKFSAYRRSGFLQRQHHPDWLKRQISIHVRDASFDFIAQRILRGTPGVVSYDNDVNPKKRLSFQFRGTIKGALDALEAKSGYGYSIDGNTVTWSAYLTRNIDISFMPGASTYLLGQRESQSNNSSSNSTDVTAGVNNQFSNLQASLSVWQDLTATLNTLKSKQGSVFVSQATTTVTVHDRPSRVRAMQAYIDDLNVKLSREVALQVQVLEVDLNRGFNYGINWQLVREYMNVHFGIAAALGRPVSLPSLGDNTSAGAAGFIIKSMQGKWAGTDMLINALSQQGKISTVTRPRVVTLNNQVAEIDINTQTGYLREVTSSIVGNPTTTAVSLTPGNVKTGFSLFLLPKIVKQDVYLQISSTISNLLGITTVTSSPDLTAQNTAQIQLPTVTEKRFNQRTLVPSGSTLVLAGFKQLRNEANNTKLFKLNDLGSRGAKQSNSETIVLITPTVINSGRG